MSIPVAWTGLSPGGFKSVAVMLPMGQMAGIYQGWPGPGLIYGLIVHLRLPAPAIPSECVELWSVTATVIGHNDLVNIWIWFKGFALRIKRHKQGGVFKVQYENIYWWYKIWKGYTKIKTTVNRMDLKFEWFILNITFYSGQCPPAVVWVVDYYAWNSISLFSDRSNQPLKTGPPRHACASAPRVHFLPCV